MPMDKFLKELNALMKKHKVNLQGNLSVRNSDEVSSQAIDTMPYIICGGLKDNCGPFLVFDVVFKEEDRGKVFDKAPQINSFTSFRSPVDNSIINSSADLKNHNKRHNCEQVGHEHEGLVNELKEAAKEKEYQTEVQENYQVKWH